MAVKPDPRLFDTAPISTAATTAGTAPAAVDAVPSASTDSADVVAPKKRAHTWRITQEQRTKIVFWVGQNVDKLQGKTLMQVEKVLKSHFAAVPSRQNISRIMTDCGVTLVVPKAAAGYADKSYCTRLMAFRNAYRVGVAGAEVTEALATIVDALNSNNCLPPETATLVAEKLYRAYTLYIAMQRRRLTAPDNELLRLHWEAAGGDDQRPALLDQDAMAATATE
jgi:hypothetical protein